MRAYEIGANDYVSKPFSPFQLTERISVLLGRTTVPPSRHGPCE